MSHYHVGLERAFCSWSGGAVHGIIDQKWPSNRYPWSNIVYRRKYCHLTFEVVFSSLMTVKARMMCYNFLPLLNLKKTHNPVFELWMILHSRVIISSAPPTSRTPTSPTSFGLHFFKPLVWIAMLTSFSNMVWEYLRNLLIGLFKF